jgi:CRISPR-associated endonuclease Cas3-HD
VAKQARDFAEVFGAGELAYVAGLLHDIGKAGKSFQDYLWNAYKFPTLVQKKVDHSSAGAVLARAFYEDTYKDLIASQGQGAELAWVIAAHHAGLADREGLEHRLLRKANDESITSTIPIAEEHIQELKKLLESIPPAPERPTMLSTEQLKSLTPTITRRCTCMTLQIILTLVFSKSVNRVTPFA